MLYVLKLFCWENIDIYERLLLLMLLLTIWTMTMRRIMIIERKREEGCCRWKGGACCCAISMSVWSPSCGVRRSADLSAMVSDPMGISDLTDCVLTMYMLTVVNNLHFQSICHSPILAVCVCSLSDKQDRLWSSVC